MRRMRAACAITCVMIAVAGDAHAAPGLHVERGAMELRGRVQFSIDAVQRDFADDRTGFRVDVSPTFSYFVLDGLSVGGGLLIGASFGDLYQGATTEVGFGVSVGYVLPLRRVLPFVDFTLGPVFYIPDNGFTATALLLSFDLGVLVPLSRSVALSLSISPMVTVGLSHFNGTLFTVPIGSAGVRAFF